MDSYEFLKAQKERIESEAAPMKCKHCGEEIAHFRRGSWYHVETDRFDCSFTYATPADADAREVGNGFVERDVWADAITAVKAQMIEATNDPGDYNINIGLEKAIEALETARDKR